MDEQTEYDPNLDVRKPCGKPEPHDPHWGPFFTSWCEGEGSDA